MRKRERMEIVYDILFSILNRSGKIKPTQLMTKANLSYKMMNEYLDDLVEKNLVAKTKRNQRHYLEITDKGRDFIEKAMRMKRFKETIGI
jgi:predicted transcriptional regulator